MPRSSGRMSVWLPTFGCVWQVVQVPFSVATPSASFTPRTPDMRMVLVLNTVCPRAIAARRLFWVLPVRPAQALNIVIALWLNAVRIVDAEEAVQRAQRLRPAGRARQVQRTRDVVTLLRDHQVHLEVDDGG